VDFSRSVQSEKENGVFLNSVSGNFEAHPCVQLVGAQREKLNAWKRLGNFTYEKLPMKI